MPQPQPNKNMLARAGYDMTDMDYITEFGVDPNKSIDMQMFDIVEQQNRAAYLEAGFTEKDATMKAKKRKQEAMATMKEQVGIK